MKLAKAIEIGELNLKEAGPKMPPDCKDAIQLLINSARRIEQLRKMPLYPFDTKLPGETPE
ncbi:unnamed protein product [marine sediment metagenome]|uniref:Uncharacterized protein n=1 Tax=marine sediment metagenome TaxID=412755 RepID=X1NMW8_9ZZZZ